MIMRKKILFFFCFGFVFELASPLFAYSETDSSPPAQSGGGKVVDLGEMSVQGELRKPNISWIDSQKNVRDILPDYLKSEFNSFEAKLVTPAPIPPSVHLQIKDDLEKKEKVVMKGATYNAQR